MNRRGSPPRRLKAAASSPARPCASAFTLVEIALSLAIIGFALVAIIGILPLGMRVQKENREETIINQDAAYWMEALRGGARGLDDLTNYVRGITITNLVAIINPSGGVESQVVNLYVFTNRGPNLVPIASSTLSGNPTTPQVLINESSNIIGLLTVPKYQHVYNFPSLGYIASVTNRVVAYVQAISGSAAEKSPQTNEAIQELAFSYQLTSEVVPFFALDPVATNYTALLAGDPQILVRSNLFHYVRNFQNNLHELRLWFRWPYLPNGGAGNGRQVFRINAGGTLTSLAAGIVPPPNCPPLEFHFFVSRSYTRAP